MALDTFHLVLLPETEPAEGGLPVPAGTAAVARMRELLTEINMGLFLQVLPRHRARLPPHTQHRSHTQPLPPPHLQVLYSKNKMSALQSSTIVHARLPIAPGEEGQWSAESRNLTMRTRCLTNFGKVILPLTERAVPSQLLASLAAAAQVSVTALISTAQSMCSDPYFKGLLSQPTWVSTGWREFISKLSPGKPFSLSLPPSLPPSLPFFILLLCCSMLSWTQMTNEGTEFKHSCHSTPLAPPGTHVPWGATEFTHTAGGCHPSTPQFRWSGLYPTPCCPCLPPSVPSHHTHATAPP